MHLHVAILVHKTGIPYLTTKDFTNGTFNVSPPPMAMHAP